MLITRDTDTAVSNVEISDPGLPDNNGNTSRDHFAVVFNASVSKPPPVRTTVAYRKFKSTDVNEFKTDILTSSILNRVQESSNVDELVDVYSNGLSFLLDKHAPLKSKIIVLRLMNPWYSQELHVAKHLKRKLEQKWRLTGLTIDHAIYRNQCAVTNKLLNMSKVKYYEKVESCGRDMKNLVKVTRHLMGETTDAVLPSGKPANVLAQDFSDFFIDKVEGIRSDIARNKSHQQTDSVVPETPFSGEQFSNFSVASDMEIAKIIRNSPNKSCELDPIPTWLMKDCLNELLPLITKICNTSLEKAYVPPVFKSSRVRPLIKKTGLNQDVMKNYRPVSNLSFVSKILEKAVDSQLERHLSAHKLHEERQSA